MRPCRGGPRPSRAGPFLAPAREHMFAGRRIAGRPRAARRDPKTTDPPEAMPAHQYAWMLAAGLLVALLALAAGDVMRRAEDTQPEAPPVEELLRSEEHTSELQSREKLVCRRLLEK